MLLEDIRLTKDNLGRYKGALKLHDGKRVAQMATWVEVRWIERKPCIALVTERFDDSFAFITFDGFRWVNCYGNRTMIYYSQVVRAVGTLTTPGDEPKRHLIDRARGFDVKHSPAWL